MTSLLTRPRAAVAAGVGVALAASLLGASAAHAAGPYDGLIVLDEGHADMFYLKKDASGAPQLLLHSDEYGDHAPEDYLIHVRPSVHQRTAGASVASLLGISNGSAYYLGPQTNLPGHLFLGFGYNTTVADGWTSGSIDVTHTLSNFDGAGDLVLWQSGDEGPEAWISSVTGDWDFTSPASHEHLAWGFTELGEYSFDVTSTFTEGGVEHVTGTQTYTFYVGEELPQDPAGPVTVEVTGVAAHYHAGEIAVLTAAVTGSDEDHFHWFTRPNATADWIVVPGALSGTYGFAVTSEHQVKAVLYDHDHEVIAESDPVQIAIDDHGNDPVIGPEIAVGYEEAEGALVVSVAAGSQRAELSDLVLNSAADRLVAEGAIDGITVTDTRSGQLGWTANGRVRGLVTVDGATLAGRYLGWTPELLSSGDGQNVTAGAHVNPGFIEGNGIQAWNALGSAAAGASMGTAVLGADIRIEAPTTTVDGDYTGVVLITVI